MQADSPSRVLAHSCIAHLGLSYLHRLAHVDAGFRIGEQWPWCAAMTNTPQVAAHGRAPVMQAAGRRVNAPGPAHKEAHSSWTDRMLPRRSASMSAPQQHERWRQSPMRLTMTG